jgi:hypothetical protein
MIIKLLKLYTLTIFILFFSVTYSLAMPTVQAFKDIITAACTKGDAQWKACEVKGHDWLLKGYNWEEYTYKMCIQITDYPRRGRCMQKMTLLTLELVRYDKDLKGWVPYLEDYLTCEVSYKCYQRKLSAEFVNSAWPKNSNFLPVHLIN